MSMYNEKKYASPFFFSDTANVFSDSHKVIHHSHVTREIYGYAHNFCNKKVREMTDKSGQYFFCIFHNGFRFDITFLTKGLWLSLWQTQDIFLLGSGLTSLKSYSLGHHVKFIDSVKYHQQPLAKLARSTDKNEKKRIHSLFCSNYLAYVQVYYSQSFLSLPKEDMEFVLEYLSLYLFILFLAFPKTVIFGILKVFIQG